MSIGKKASCLCHLRPCPLHSNPTLIGSLPKLALPVLCADVNCAATLLGLLRQKRYRQKGLANVIIYESAWHHIPENLQYSQDQDSHSYKTTGEIIFLYISIFTFLDSKLQDKRFFTKWQQASPEFNLLLISSAMKFLFVSIVPIYLNFTRLSNDL